MKRNLSLHAKLAAYAAMATAGAASIGTSDAQIIYTDIPDVNFAVADSFNLDFNADAVFDYTLKHTVSSWTLYGSTYIRKQMYCKPRVDGNMAYTEASIAWAAYNWYGRALVLNEPINAAAVWNCPGNLNAQSRVFFASSLNTIAYGNFETGADLYLGCKFKISGATHYGWMRVNIGTGLTSMTLKDYAYESTPDAAILAGDKPSVGISDAILSDVNIHAFNKRITISDATVGATVNIINNVGQLVKATTIDASTMVIDLPEVQSGIYLVQIQSGNQAITKKVSL